MVFLLIIWMNDLGWLRDLDNFFPKFLVDSPSCGLEKDLLFLLLTIWSKEYLSSLCPFIPIVCNGVFVNKKKKILTGVIFKSWWDECSSCYGFRSVLHWWDCAVYCHFGVFTILYKWKVRKSEMSVLKRIQNDQTIIIKIK